ncbi:DUF2505 domain-containing protein [Auritidibacter ignavus]|uniref:DUF2505 domain-containing protein n=1 Tax=Auritidibacter ignavus TaxID=678932 RepID=A0AAJ6AK82_9MICC|nr:DUF2505 domain-containing protein [Auritidibacter ignavus]WGH94267.1 DUF2505 domain-containing protein [Auritidibacter ignavus]
MAFAENITVHHPVAHVFQALTSHDFHRHATEQVGATLTEFQVADGDDGPVKVTIIPHLSGEAIQHKVPHALRSLVTDGVEIRQEVVWSRPAENDSRTALLRILIPIARAESTVTQTLSATSTSDTDYAVEGNLQCHIPFIGSALVSTLEPQVSKVIATQARAIDAWLAEH